MLGAVTPMPYRAPPPPLVTTLQNLLVYITGTSCGRKRRNDWQNFPPVLLSLANVKIPEFALSKVRLEN